MRAILALALAAVLVSAQDPPPGWTAYATGNCPAGTRLTKMEANWKVLGNAPASQSFYSPWFGSDTTDNLNLLQPVNPWFGSSWNFYTEYFQWSPTRNVDSTSQATTTGNVLHGEIVFNGVNEQSYTVSQTDLTQGLTSRMTIPVQKDSNGVHKNFTVLYVVFEKLAPCYNYPPDQIVTFTDINVYCDGTLITPQWTTAVVDEVCDFTAHIVNPHEISITWNTQSTNHPAKHLIEQSQADRVLGRRFPKRSL
jgi:hypothetical protein